MDTKPYSYTLTVVQQPFHARMCGYGEKDRRPIDPPPIVKLTAIDAIGAHVDPSELANPQYVIHCSLYSEDGTTQCDLMWNPPRNPQVLLGTRMATPELYEDVDGSMGTFFCFTDLSVRIEGTFRIGFTLLGVQDSSLPPSASHIISTLSTPFKVYSAKQFPGMRESTELCKQFKKQGLSIAIRKGVRGGGGKFNTNCEQPSSTNQKQPSTCNGSSVKNDTNSVSSSVAHQSCSTGSKGRNDTDTANGSDVSKALEESISVKSECQDQLAPPTPSSFIPSSKGSGAESQFSRASLSVNPNVSSSPSLLNPTIPLIEVDSVVCDPSITSPKCSNGNTCQNGSATTDHLCNNSRSETGTSKSADKMSTEMFKSNSPSNRGPNEVAEHADQQSQEWIRPERRLLHPTTMTNESEESGDRQIAPGWERFRDDTIDALLDLGNGDTR